MATRSVRFDFLKGRVTADRGAEQVADKFESLSGRFERAGVTAGKKFGDGFGDGVDTKRGGFSNLLKKLITPNPRLFETLRSPIEKGLSTPLGLAVGGALAHAVAVALPAGISLGLGGGLIALGAFALRGSNMLKKHFAAAGKSMSDSLARAAAPLVGPFKQAINVLAGGVRQLEPQFKRLFRAVAPSIRPFTEAMIGFVRNALPGIERAMPAVNTAFAALSAKLPGLGTSVGNFFAAITSNLPAIERGIGLMTGFADVTLKVAGAFLNLTAKASNSFANVGAFLGKVKEYTVGLHGSNQAVAGSAKGTTAAQGALAVATARAQTAAVAQIAANKEARETFLRERSAIASVIPMFEGYKNKSSVTKATILSNLRQEVAAYSNWATNAQRLLRRGVDPAVIKALSDKGPQYVAAFAKASDRELAALSSMFKARTTAAGNVAIATAGPLGAAAGRAMAAAMSANFRPRLAVPRPGAVQGPAPYSKASTKVMALGGVLHEPVAGYGLKSGTRYLMGEKGPEAVVPLGKGGKGGGRKGGGGLTFGKALSEIGQNLGRGFVIGIRKHTPKAIKTMKILSQRLANTAKKARENLNKRLADFRGGFAQGAQGGFDLVSLFGTSGEGGGTVSHLIQGMRGKFEGLRKFGVHLKSLVQRGAPKSLVQQLALAGPDQAGGLVSALAGATGGELGEVGQLFRGFHGMTGSIANSLIPGLFGSDIARVRKLEHEAAVARRVYNVVVNVSPTANQGEIGAQIVKAIKAYEKNNGKRWRS